MKSSETHLQMSAYENAQDQFPAAAQVEEETKMEEGVARESLASLCEEEVHKTAVKTAVHFGLPTVIPNKKTPKKDRNLSKVSRMYDMDGDGQLGKLLTRDISCHVANYLSHEVRRLMLLKMKQSKLCVIWIPQALGI